MDNLKYVVLNPDGETVLISTTGLRYRPERELQLLEDGYTIKIDDKRLTKADVRALFRSKGQRPVREVRKR